MDPTSFTVKSEAKVAIHPISCLIMLHVLSLEDKSLELSWVLVLEPWD